MTNAAAGPFVCNPSELPDLTGRTAVVTGASSGLGAVVAAALARSGATVVMAVRDLGKGEQVRSGFGDAAAGRTFVRHLELADLDSVARFAAGVRAEHPRLHLLVNNAGTAAAPDRLSAQGYEAIFATNHLGHFALTGHLLDLLQHTGGSHPPSDHQSSGNTAGPRVVTVGSNLYRRVNVGLPLDDLAADVSPGRAYVASKLAVLLFAVELDRRLRAAQSPLRSLAAHPGVAATPMQQQAGSAVQWVAGRALNLILGRSAEAGAIPLLSAATAPDVPAGRFLGPSLHKRDLRVHADPLVAPATDTALAERLWTVSETATGVPLAPGPAQRPRGSEPSCRSSTSTAREQAAP